MVFSSHIFLFYFLPIFLAIYYLLPFKWKGFYVRNAFITVMSYIFYGWLVPWFVILMFITSYKDFICGRIISKPGQLQWKRKAALVFAIVADLSLLGFYKYYMFAMDNVNHLIQLFGGGPHTFFIYTVLLPSGISFYTFVALSYTIDVYRGDALPARNFSMFSCFVGLFPHLIAGPIIRYSSVAEQLDNRKHTLAQFSSGTALFMLGFAKKIILANGAGEVADMVFGAKGPGVINAWWGVIAYSFQIYFDFCGYSDMAVGLARMMGIEFIKNFNAPYHSKSISEFWRRWHISLSSFIRDYLYFPLGGNRKGVGRTYFNLAVSMFLCGLWHGAKMTFIVWGVFLGGIMILERLRGKKGLYDWLPGFGQIACTFVLMLFSWVLFRSPTLHQALAYWGAMFGVTPSGTSALLLRNEAFSPRHIFDMVLCALVIWQPVQAHEWVGKLSPVKMALCVVVFIIAIATMFTQTFNPFLYFQF
ncbi:MAG: hypothetical protein PHC61_03260 [Chitinivibrionales bacterium]|nr:hypothetical protein [Chitinivibrionales bacterium]